MNDRQPHKLSLAGFIITFVGSILFSTKAIIVKKAFAGTHTDAVTLLTLRMIFSLPFFLIAALVVSNQAGNKKMNPKQWLAVTAIGLTGYYISSLCDFIGLQYISAGLERLILFLYPTFAVLINAWIFKHKMSRAQQAALLLTYLGIAIAYMGELKIDNHNPNFLYGSFMVFLCAVTFSIYLVGSGKNHSAGWLYQVYCVCYACSYGRHPASPAGGANRRFVGKRQWAMVVWGFAGGACHGYSFIFNGQWHEENWLEQRGHH